MERLWSPAVATGGNRCQIEQPRKRLKQAKTVADGCDQLPGPQNGKEGVDGSSPSEGLKYLQIDSFVVHPDGMQAVGMAGVNRGLICRRFVR